MQLRKDLNEQVHPKLKAQDCCDEAKVLAKLEEVLPEQKGIYTTDEILHVIKDWPEYQCNRITGIAKKLGPDIEFKNDTFMKFRIKGRKTYSVALEASEWRDKADAFVRQQIQHLMQQP